MKNTISKYGWIVVVVIIIIILLGFSANLVNYMRDSFVGYVDEISDRIPDIDDFQTTIDYSSLAPGLYKTGTDKLIKPWNELIDEEILKLENGKLSLNKGYDAYASVSTNAQIKATNVNPLISTYAKLESKHLTGYLVVSTDVTAIDDYSFVETVDLSGIVLPDTVTEIGSSTFMMCDQLTFVVFSENTTKIGSMTFAMCSNLKTVVIPGVLEEIGTAPFAGAPYVEIELAQENEKYKFINNCVVDTETKTLVQGFANSVIPDDGSVTSIGSGAFYMCKGLKNINIADCITTIEDLAFVMLENNVSSITVGENNPNYLSINNCLIIKDTKELLLGCKNSIIPDDGSVESINDYAFIYCAGLSNVNIPSSVEAFSSSCFTGCTNIETLAVGEYNPTYRSENNCIIEKETGSVILGCKNSTIPEDPSITSIAYNAFAGCEGLERIIIPGNIKVIDEQAFYMCKNLKSVTIESGVETINEKAFSECTKLAIVDLPETITTIANYAFKNCALTSVRIPASVSKLYYASFVSIKDMVITIDENNPTYRLESNCIIEKSTGKIVVAYKGFVIPNDGSIKKIGNYAFGESDATSIVLPSSVNEIESVAFYECKNLISMVIPDGITTLKSGILEYCESLTSVTIPSSVTLVEGYALAGCESLTDIYFQGTKAQWNAITFKNYWNNDTGVYTIHCSDGDISK